MNFPSVSPPEAARRLFPDISDTAFERLEPTPFVIGRLLEEGDRSDLRWLFIRAGESALATWVVERGSRQLSRRSLALWSLLLSAGESERLDNPLWPL